MRNTNGLAIASLVCGAFVFTAIPALVLGYIAKNQIDENGGTQGGRGLAIAGIVLGWVGIAIGAFIALLLALVVDTANHVIQQLPSTTSPTVGSTSTSPLSNTGSSSPNSNGAGGSGNTSPSAITTSSNCPANFSATLNKPSYSLFPPMTINTSKTYTATVSTDVGSFSIRLDPVAAPQAVNSFVYLASQHFFDCIVFHRVITGFVDQAGDPTGTGTGGPGYQFADELPTVTSPQYPLGSVAMANNGPNTNGSQFFVVAGPEGEGLSPNYTLFGTVTSGMTVVERINSDGSPASSSQGIPTTLHRIVSVSVTQS